MENHTAHHVRTIEQNNTHQAAVIVANPEITSALKTKTWTTKQNVARKNVYAWYLRSGYAYTDLWSTFKSQTLQDGSEVQAWQSLTTRQVSLMANDPMVWGGKQWRSLLLKQSDLPYSWLLVPRYLVIAHAQARGADSHSLVPSPARSICDVVHPATAGDTTPQAASACSIHIDRLWDRAWSRANISSRSHICSRVKFKMPLRGIFFSMLLNLLEEVAMD